MEPIVKIIINGVVSVALLALVATILIILRRTRRGEKAVTDEDWRFFFGKAKAEVLTVHYGARLVLALVVCLVSGLAAYLVLFPYGPAWYVLGMVVTTFVIVLLTAKALR